MAPDGTGLHRLVERQRSGVSFGYLRDRGRFPPYWMMEEYWGDIAPIKGWQKEMAHCVLVSTPRLSLQLT